MFPFAPSITADITLDDVLARLQESRAVEGIVLIGSTGTERLVPSSDYDLFVVLSSCPVPLWQVVTTIEGRVAEAYFQPVEAIRRIVDERAVPAHTDSPRALYTRWLMSGRVVFDRSGLLEEARSALTQAHLITMWTGKELYIQWFRINYNLNETRRLLVSTDPAVLTTIALRLLYSIYDVWVNYFRFRSLPWLGDKESIAYLQANDPAFLRMVEQALRETDPASRFALYEKLCETATAPVAGLWPGGSTGVQMDPAGEWKMEDLQPALDFWHGLVSGK